VLFPLGVLLGGAGVLPWLLFALGLADVYRPIFHSVVFRSMFHPLAEIEGFVGCFAVGSLFAILPRRTSTAPPSAWQVALAFAAPIAITICAAAQKWVVGQVAWLVLIGMVIEFSLRRLRSPAAPRRWPEASVWIGLALVVGVIGSVLAGAGEASGKGGFRLHELGRSLLMQGLFGGLALGIAGLLPGGVETGGELPPARRVGWAYVQALGAALYFASFWVGHLVSLPLGFALRAAVTLGIVFRLVRSPPLSKRLDAPGRAIRTALWMLPLGNAWAALVPESRRAGMHIIYLGCFAVLVLVVSMSFPSPQPDRLAPLPHVTARRLQIGWVWLALALGSRILVEMDPPNFKLWLGLACTSFVIATLFTFQGFAARLVRLLPTGEDEPPDRN
jgi:hypothetical protein